MDGNWYTNMAPYVYTIKQAKQLLQSVTLKTYYRFMDSKCLMWIHCRGTIETFLAGANDFHQTIKRTAEISNGKHVFLDTTSHLEVGRVA